VQTQALTASDALLSIPAVLIVCWVLSTLNAALYPVFLKKGYDWGPLYVVGSGFHNVKGVLDAVVFFAVRAVQSLGS
jgi:hypothetical protein